MFAEVGRAAVAQIVQTYDTKYAHLFDEFINLSKFTELQWNLASSRFHFRGFRASRA